MLTFLRSAPLLAAALLVGCGGSGGVQHPTTEVTATVMYKGSPVEGATVTFVNTDHDKAVIAVGRTDTQGVAKMRTYSDGDGAVKGTHKVTITKSAVTESQADVAEVDSDAYDPDVPVAASGGKSPIPLKYGSAASGLTIEVGDAPVNHTFELVD